MRFWKKGIISRDRLRASNLKTINSRVASVGSVRNVERVVPVRNDCDKKHFEECKSKLGACFRYVSTEHFLRDFPLKQNESGKQISRQEVTSQRGRRLGNGRNSTLGRGKTVYANDRSEARAPVRA